MAMEKMLAGLSTRRYAVGLEPVGEQVAETSSATSKSAVSRRFVAMTETALAELLDTNLSGLDLVALMIDGVHFAESCCIVALGIGIDGVKHPLALVEGSTENATLVTGLLVDLRERGLDVTRPMLVGIDGFEGAAQGGARRARPPGHPALPTAQGSERERSSATTTSKRRGLQDDRRLPRRISAGGRSRPAGPGQRTRPYPPRGGGEPRGPGRDLDGATPERGAHAGADVALDELHRVDDLGLPRTRRQRQTLARRQMALRWCAAGMVEAGKQFRRVNGHLHLPTLRAALERETAEPVGTISHDDQVSAA